MVRKGELNLGVKVPGNRKNVIVESDVAQPALEPREEAVFHVRFPPANENEVHIIRHHALRAAFFDARAFVVGNKQPKVSQLAERLASQPAVQPLGPADRIAGDGGNQYFQAPEAYLVAPSGNNHILGLMKRSGILPPPAGRQNRMLTAR